MIRVNWDALLARIVYVWRWRVALVGAALAAFVALAAGLVPPFWRGEASLAVSAAPGAALTLDGRPWPATIYAGDYTVAARLPDGRSASADVSLRAGEALTLTLPAGLPPPRERPIPPPAPGMRVAHVAWAGGAWRVRSDPAPTPPDEDADPGDPTPTPAPGQTVALGPRGVERLTTIDAYAGLADQLRLGDRLLEAVHRPPRDVGLGSDDPGAVEVRGWPGGSATVPLSDALTLVRFAPDGAALIVVERAAAGEQVSLARPGTPREAVVAVPGSVRRLSWRDDGSAVVVHSRAGDRLALTLVRLRPTLAAATVAELDAATYAADLAPLTWAGDALLWVAPDAGAPTLWAAPLDTLIPEARRPLDARALDALPDGTLRAVVVVRGQVAIGRLHGPHFIAETVAATVPPADDLAGIWRGDELLLQGAGGAWLLTLMGTGG